MKVRALTLGLSLFPGDFQPGGSLKTKISDAATALKAISAVLNNIGYEVQTLRISLNSFEDWIGLTAGEDGLDLLRDLDALLESVDINYCSIGYCTTVENLQIVPSLLSVSSRFSCSFEITKYGACSMAEFDRCLAASEAILRVGRLTADGLRNFSFCSSFNCPPNIPFFPASYHDVAKPPTLSVGLENGDLLFLSFHAAEDYTEARENLQITLKQVLMPLQKVLEDACKANNVAYGGIDASINPGLSPQDSVGIGIENLRPNYFGAEGTMSAIAAITGALKSIQQEGAIKLIGYCGLMLPVLEDLQLAARAAENPPAYTLRDLVAYSSVCGVGIDTVPIPGDSSAEAIASIMLDLGAVSYRHNKPLTCR
jgi:uncharacterized protein (UPF0210 family)